MNLQGAVQNIINTQWSKRRGLKVPSTNAVAFSGGALELDATFLYADLAKSSQMAKELDRRIAAKILKSFHFTTCRLIRRNSGTIQSFDGDRIMGVFTGKHKNSKAAECALQINYAVTQVIRPKFEQRYDAVRDASFYIAHGVGIDTGTVLTVRAGVRGSNDLIWIGRAPNLAAKLSDLRESTYRTFITASVYNDLDDKSKIADGKNMWESKTWDFLDQRINIYCSSWHWKP